MLPPGCRAFPEDLTPTPTPATRASCWYAAQPARPPLPHPTAPQAVQEFCTHRWGEFFEGLGLDESIPELLRANGKASCQAQAAVDGAP
jgi:hypothetical protein